MLNFKDKIGCSVPSEKTIRRHYRLIGERLFNDYAEPWLAKTNARASQLRESSPAEYAIALEKVLQIAHDAFISGSEELDRDLNECVMTYRKLSANKFGIRSGIRENFGLAFFRQLAMDRARSSISDAVELPPDTRITATIAERRADGGFAYLGCKFLMEYFKENPL